MELRKTARRHSLGTAEDARRICRPASSDGVAGRKAKRYTWAFNPVRSQNYTAAEECHDGQVLSDSEPLSKLCKSNSSASLKLQASLKARELGSESSTSSIGNPSGHRSDSKRKHSNQAGTLAPIMEKKYVEITTVVQGRGAAPKVRRWDARTRSTSVWDSLRRDSELFSQRGNCSIHFYEKGQSRRGPSLKIPLERIYSARFASLFNLYHAELARHDDFEEDIMHRQCDLYIPAPESSRKEAFTWHITTRNFFAFTLGRPVVGTLLGQALIDLRERLDLFRPNDPRNHEDFMAYLDKLGYLELAHCPDYALAILNFAEHFKLRELWVDAFVHCVGMNDALRSHAEFHHVSRVTHALIMRAYLEMDLHLGRVTRTLSNFLEDDFSPSHFGVSAGARLHLDRFRTFLNEYYVAKFGYWPPPKRANFSKFLYKSMYFDFRGLYDYLVDLDSSSSLTNQKPASGGICVLQNVKAFDERHKLMALPHPHPLLPKESSTPLRTSGSQASLMRSIRLGARHDPMTELTLMRDALAAASNANDASTASAPLVKAYQRFERESVRKNEEKVSITDARKVRWLLVYATLQMLISVIRAPKEVRMTETTYPLCCLVTGTPPWEAGTKALNSVHTPSVMPVSSTAKYLDIMSVASIHPDCEMDDYISNRTSSIMSSSASSRRTSTMSLQTNSSPTPPSRVGLFRNASIRSVKTIQSSLGSLSRRSSTRRNSIMSSSAPTLTPMTPLTPVSTITSTITKASHCEIVVHGYGNGLVDSLYTETSRFVPIEMSTESLPEIVVSQQSPPRFPSLAAPRSMSTPDVRPTSRRTIKPSDLVLQQTSNSVPESMRTPLMNGFEADLPGLGDMPPVPSSHKSSIDSNSPPDLSWSSSRSTSPHSSATSQTATESAPTRGDKDDEKEPPSPVSPSFSDSTFSLQSPTSPVSPVITFPPSLPSKKSMDLPMVVDIEEMSVYQPTGVPSIGSIQVVDEIEDDEFPDRDASNRWSVASKTRTIPVPLKSSLRRTRTAASTASSATTKKRSVRIKEEPLLSLGRFRGNSAVVVSH